MSPLYVPRKRKSAKSQRKSGSRCPGDQSSALQAFLRFDISLVSPAAFKETPERTCELDPGGLFKVRTNPFADCCFFERGPSSVSVLQKDESPSHGTLKMRRPYSRKRYERPQTWRTGLRTHNR